MSIQRTKLKQLIDDLRGDREPGSPALADGPPLTPAQSDWVVRVAALSGEDQQRLRLSLEGSGEIDAAGLPLPGGMSRDHLGRVVLVMQMAGQSK